MKKHRILLADDNDDILAAFQEGLESHGFEVDCEGGELARQIL